MKTTKSFSIKKGIRITALIIIAAFFVTAYTPVPSGAASLKEEVVYVRLNNDGSVSQVYVVNSFELGENNAIIDYGNYAYVQNLTDTSEIKLENGKVTLDAQGKELYYEGFLMNPQLPWDISIRYILDEKEISPDDISGKTGRLSIEIETGANPLGSKDFFDSYALQIAFTLDSGICKNISAKGATIASAGGSKQVNYVVLPGKATKLELSADVKNFEMPAITIGGVRLNMDFDIESYDMSQLKELTDGIADLDDGVQELLDGIFDMKEGVSDLYDGTKELRDGVGEFKDGIGELSEGTGELKDGVSELKSGAKSLASGAAAAASGGGQLVGGFSDYFDGIIALVNAQLAGSPIPIPGLELPLTRATYSDELENALYGPAIVEAREAILTELNTAKQQILQAVLGQLEPAMNYDDYLLLEDGDPRKVFIDNAVDEELLGGYDTLETRVGALLAQQMPDILAEAEIAIREGDNEQAKQLLGLLYMLKGYDQLLGGLNQYVSGVNGISSGAKGLSTGISEFHDGLIEYEDGISKYLSGMVVFYNESEKLVDGAHELKDGTVELLKVVIELKDGVVEFKDGVIELRDGVIELFDGIVELHDGVVEMNDGAIELNDGVIELTDGVGGLKDGTNDLYEGVAELKDGTGELRSETQSLDTKIVDAFKEEIDKMMGGNIPVKSFVSDKNGEVSAVQFVMQTEGISKQEVETAVVQHEPEVKLTFWQRFIALFGF